MGGAGLRRRWLTDGRYELRVPCGDATELVMDILRHATASSCARRPRRAEPLGDNSRFVARTAA